MNVKLVIFSLFALFATSVWCDEGNATNINIHVFASSSKWWIAVRPSSGIYDTIAVEVREASSPRWQPTTPNTDWGYFMLASDSGIGFAMPLSFRFTASNGQRVVANAILTSISQNQILDTGVQYLLSKDQSSSSDAPTDSPTDAPTGAPTDGPTDAPTGAPTDAPATEAPTNPPTTDAPTNPPATQAPTNPPATQAPTNPPATQAPTNPPATQAPTNPPTNPPATQAPTNPPATQPPTNPPTQPPATQPPTTKPTQAPATQPPTTKPTTAPATQPPTTKPTTAPTTPPTTKPTTAPTTPPTTDLCAIVPAATEPLKILVPLYVYPGAAWDQLATAAATGVKIIAIINPNSGPNANGPDSAYSTYITKLKNAGVELVGYVHTSWGARAIATIQSEIDIYYNKYPGLTGIFFDEGATEASALSYYTTAYNYVINKSGYKHVILNPGLEPNSGYAAISTNIVIFENYASSLASTNFGSWITCAPNAAAKSGYQYKFSGIAHTAALSNMPALASQLRAKGMGLVYITDGVGGCCTYNTLTTYFPQEAASVKSINNS